MTKIKELIDACGKNNSDDYKSGWRDAVCHVNDFYKMVRRSDGEPIEIVIVLDVSEDQILEKVCKLIKESENES